MHICVGLSKAVSRVYEISLNSSSINCLFYFYSFVRSLAIASISYMVSFVLYRSIFIESKFIILKFSELTNNAFSISYTYTFTVSLILPRFRLSLFRFRLEKKKCLKISFRIPTNVGYHRNEACYSLNHLFLFKTNER